MGEHIKNLPPFAQDIIRQFEALVNKEVSEAWFYSWDEAIRAINDPYMEAAWRYDGNRGDPQLKARYELFEQSVEPEVNRLGQLLTAKAVQHESSDDKAVQRVIAKKKLEVAVQAEANVSLEAEVAALASEFNSLVTRQTVEVEGQPLNALQVEARIQGEADRSMRERLWCALQERKLEDAARIDKLIIDIARIRKRMGEHVGLSYAEMCWRDQHRADYSPEDGLSMLDTVTEVFAGAYRERNQKKAAELQLSRLRPWDVNYIAKTESARRISEGEYVATAVAALRRIRPHFGDVIASMAQRGHLDLMSRPNKRPINYTTLLLNESQPLILGNLNEDIESFRVLFHECGHAIHFALASREKLFFDFETPFEIAEFAAYTFQTLGGRQLVKSDFLQRTERSNYQRSVFDTMLFKMQNYSDIERFQHRLYATDGTLLPEELDASWMALQAEYAVDWTGLEAYQAKGWQHGHVVNYPFYSVNYVIAWVGALLFLKRYFQDENGAVGDLDAALRLGGARGVGGTFKAMGLNFPFNRSHIESAYAAFRHEFADALL